MNLASLILHLVTTCLLIWLAMEFVKRRTENQNFRTLVLPALLLSNYYHASPRFNNLMNRTVRYFLRLISEEYKIKTFCDPLNLSSKTMHLGTFYAPLGALSKALLDAVPESRSIMIGVEGEICDATAGKAWLAALPEGSQVIFIWREEGMSSQRISDLNDSPNSLLEKHSGIWEMILRQKDTSN